MSEPDETINEPFQTYLVEHELTESYVTAQTALGSGRLDDAEKLFLAEPKDSPCYGLALGYRALTLFRLDRLEEAEAAMNVALIELKRGGTPHHPSAIQFLRTHGDILLRQGRPTEAVPRYEETIGIAEKIAGKMPKDAGALEREVAHTRNALGAALSRLGRADDAIREFMAARDTYRKYPNQVWSGLSETLTNLAEACLSKENPDPGRAEAALEEALDVAKKEGNADQLWRTRMKMIQFRSKLISPKDRDAIFDAGVKDAVRQGRWGTAYLRRCIQAQVAAEDGRHDDGLRAITEAHALESRLDAADPHPAQLRLTHARLLWQAKEPADDVLRVLIEGAFLWFERLGRPLVRNDFRRTTADTHDHFRLLARKLLDAGRLEEALAAFEAGRTLAYAGEVNPDLPAKLFAASANPFELDGSKVRTSLLGGIRRWLGDAVIIIPTVLPPDFVAFVLSPTGVSIARAPYPDPAAAAGEHEAATLFRSIMEIPHLLSKERTANVEAVPAPLRELARQVRTLVRDKPVRIIAPHADLHMVPWRTLLGESGIPWRQMPCATEFSLLLRGSADPSTVTVATAVGLGHGDASGIDFRDEAKAFVRPFGPNGTFVATCMVQDVRHALSGDKHAVIISAHGGVRTRFLGSSGEFALGLQSESDNSKTVDVFLPEFLPEAVHTRMVNLSACSSGVYEMGWGDYPNGVGPLLLLRGARYCIICRFPIRATFARDFSEFLAVRLAKGLDVPDAVAEALEEAEAKGWERWRDHACIELLGRP